MEKCGCAFLYFVSKSIAILKQKEPNFKEKYGQNKNKLCKVISV